MTARWSVAMRSVVRAPGVIEHALPSLLAPFASDMRRADRTTARQTARLALRMLSALGRLQRFSVNRWRVTCLYRSVAECLVLRELGYAARVVIGARADDASGSIAAHAWVECDDVACYSTKGDEHYEVLSVSSATSAVL